MSEQDSAGRTCEDAYWQWYRSLTEQAALEIGMDPFDMAEEAWKQSWNAGVEAERARCLQIVDEYVYTTFHTPDRACAAAISSAIRNRFRALGMPTEAPSVPVQPLERCRRCHKPITDEGSHECEDWED